MPPRQDSYRFRALIYSCLISLFALCCGGVLPACAESPQGMPVSALPDAPTPQSQPSSPSHSSSVFRDTGRSSVLWKAPSVYGIRPVFTAVNNWNAPPLTFHQKAHLYFRQITGPWIAFTSIVGGSFGQLDNHPAYGGGYVYFKHVGSSYADQVDGDFWHNLILPQLFHEDPRYFRKGSGPVMHRFLWAASAPVWSRRDNMTWGINYSHIVGNVIGSAIGNVYRPQSNRTVEQTFGRAFLGLAESTAASELAEFWPAIAHRVGRRRYRKMQQQEARERQLMRQQQQ